MTLGAALSAADAPLPAPVPDKDTVLLLRLDGDARDASGCGNHGNPLGEVKWVEGRSGKALSVEGKGGLEIPPAGVLTIDGQSWTVEAWIRPAKVQPAHAQILSSGFANSIGYGLRISYNKHLYAMFEAGPGKGGNGGSGDLTAKLFDDAWHHVAAVLDRDRGGEVRVYLDGVDVTADRVAQPLPIAGGAQGTALTIGLTAPWVLEGGFVGLIDDVCVTRGVRAPYRVKAAPAAAPAAEPAELKADANPPALVLRPAETVILRAASASAVEVKAAVTLQEWLRKVYGVKEGFEILPENAGVEGKFVLAIGPGPWLPKAARVGMEGRDFLLVRQGDRVVMAGGAPAGTLRAVAAFLDRFCGVRFYMPTDLYTSLPVARQVSLGVVDVRDKPRIRDIHMGMFWNLPEENDWMLRNGVGIKPEYLASHSMDQRFPPARFAVACPEIYPILKGARYIPKAAGDQGWQPCFSEPKTLDAAEEEAVEYFRRNPAFRGITYAVQDGHAFCECPRCLALIAKAGDKTQAYSDMFWGFLNRLAERLERRLPEFGVTPDKVLIGMAYSEVRNPPGFKLHRNVMAYPVFTVADILIDKVLEPTGPYSIHRWSKVAAQLGQYDWAQGDGYYIPRLYAGLAARLFDADHRFTLATAETYPNWGLDGPKYWMLVKIWDAPGADARALYAQFCADMFGKAAAEMEAHFQTLEALWVSMDNDAERKLFKWTNQFTLRPEQRQSVSAARAHLDRAAGLVQTPEQKARLDLFSKTFRLSEMIFEVANAPKVNKARVEAIRRYAAEVIAPDPMTMNTKGQGGPAADYVNGQVRNILAAITAGKDVE
jgi:hypothetical protein